MPNKDHTKTTDNIVIKKLVERHIWSFQTNVIDTSWET